MLNMIRMTIAGGAVERGTVRYYKGQGYTCVGFKPYKTKKGLETMLAEFESHCAECGKVFRLFVAGGSKFEPNRRCQTHKRPGVPVGLPKLKPRAPSSRKTLQGKISQEDYPF